MANADWLATLSKVVLLKDVFFQRILNLLLPINIGKLETSWKFLLRVLNPTVHYEVNQSTLCNGAYVLGGK